MKIKYKSGYKYQLVESFKCLTGYFPEIDIVTEYIEYYNDGMIKIIKGYAWDGPSGPTIDTKNFMRGALVHDALYQLMREGYIPQSFREQADLLLKEMCLQDGMSRFRAWYVYRCVKFGAGFASNPKNKKVVMEAP